MKKLALLFLLLAQLGFSQVGINTITPNAQLDIRSGNQVTPSNTDGLLIPKIDAFPLANPTALQQGMMVYLTTTSGGKLPGFYYWDNVTVNWLGFGGTTGWGLAGNAGTNPAVNFIGTTDANDVIFKRDNVHSGRIGQANTSFGRSSLNPLNTGIYNSAFGLASLAVNTSGNSNSAFGNYALNSTTSGSANTGFGSNVMYSNTIGQQNTAVGSSAFERNTTGNNNSAFGYYSLYNSISGNNNTSIGLQTLYNSTGSNNTALGYRSGYATTTGGNNITIGANSEIPTPATSDQMSIGNVIYGADMSTTALGKIGIGVPVPTEKLEIAGKTKTTNLQMTNGAALNYILTSDALGNGTWQNPTAILTNTAWSITGNSGTNPSTNFIGTTDNNDLIFKRNNAFVGKLTDTNVSFGIGALSPTSTGGNNIALGSQSLFSNTTGYSNIANGTLSLYSNTTGFLNIAAGITSMYSNTTGSNNVAAGNASLISNTTGNYNVAQGMGSVNDNTTGSQNTGIGYHALNNNVTGNYNSAFGSEANVAAGNLNNATALGSNAFAASSNSVILGSINGVNGGTSTASVGIGTTVPTAVLDVASPNKGILIPRVALTATTQVLPVTNPQGGALPTSTMVYNTQTTGDVRPGYYYWNGTKWVRFDVDGEGKPKYYTVLGTTNVTATTSSTLMPEMTQTFTPNSTLVFAQFSASGYNNTCGQYSVHFNLLLDGIPIKGFQTSMEDINNVSRPIWDLSTTYPITVTPGVPHTISIEWYSPNPCAAGVFNNVATPAATGNSQSHRVLTIIDPNGGGGVVGTAPVIYADAWKVTGNSGTNPATNFIGTTDNIDVVFKRNNMKSGLIGPNNTSFGYASLLANTAGLANTAIGSLSLYENSTGNYNVAAGNNALTNNTVGSYNVAVGQYALGSGSSESWSTAIGYNAMMYSNSSTTPFNGYNTALGGNALRGSLSPFNNTGNHNTALGVQALFGTSSGSYNTASGVNSMISNTTGSFNTSTGMQAMNGNTTGNNNTVVGTSALFTNSTGNNNVALGYQAGYSELGSNRLYIENSASATPLIYGEFDTDLARINGNFRVKSTTITPATGEMQVKNSNIFQHPSDLNLNFGTGGNYFMMSTQDAGPSTETTGIRGDGDNVSIWSPGDGNRLLRLLDEDFWGDNNGNPYDAGAEMAYIASNGQYFQVSDQNKKENIRKIENATDKISQISGYTYQYKLNQKEIEKGQKPVVASGVLAQEVELVLPEAIQKNESGEYFVDYAAITPLLIEALKEQNAKIKSLEAVNAEILKRLETLEKK